MKVPMLTAAALSGVCLFTPASAATINGFALSTASGAGEIPQAVTQIDETALVASDAQTVSVDFSGSPTSPALSSSASHALSANGQTGQLRFGLTGARDAGVCSSSGCDADYSASVNIGITEDITVSGTGTLTAFMAVDASWNSPRWNFAASLATVSQQGNDNSSLGFSSFPGVFLDDPAVGLIDPATNGGFVDTLLTSQIDISNATDLGVQLIWRIWGDISSGFDAGAPANQVAGFMDAMNTANIYYVLSEGVTLTSSTEGFLSDPAYLGGNDGGGGVSPVPVPASLPLLLSGIFIANWVSRSQRRSKASS